MGFKNKLISAQEFLEQANWGGWLLYDFRKTNDLACRFLELPSEKMCTRRFFYWLPTRGTPVKIVHRIESNVLDHLPGNVVVYSSWQELEMVLKHTLSGASTVAMEYSPRNAIPYVSKVDAGTVDLIRSFGIEVVSSADLLQRYTSVWTPEQLKSHLFAARVLDEAVSKAWRLIGDSIERGTILTEKDVQQFILREFKNEGCICEDPPICAVNAHAADPHYSPDANTSSVIKAGDEAAIERNS